MPRGLRSIDISVDATGLTRFGGLVLFQQFCKSLGLRRFLQTCVAWPPYHDRKFHPADLFLTHLYAKVAGLGRVESLKALKLNGLLPALLGLPEPPHRDTLRTFLWRFTGEDLRQLRAGHDRLRARLFEFLGPVYSAVLDIDSTALTVYGQQDGATLGYNPGRQGKKCYSALVASEGRLGLSLDVDLRAGREHPSTGALPMLRSGLEKLPATVAASRTRVRADASFYDQDIARFLDDAGLGYALVARLTTPLQSRVPGLHFREFREGWGAAEFRYTPACWTTPHRFVAIRHLLKEEDARTFLFRIRDYDYRVVVTNLDLEPEAVWRFYTDRAIQELVIRELKTAFAGAHIPTRSWLANAVHVEITLWAYDVVLAFKHLCLPERYQSWTVGTLRRDLWGLPGQWVRTGNRNVLRLPASFRYVDVLHHAQRAIPQVKALL